MIITHETHIKNFEFWGGAKTNVKDFTEEIWDQFEMYFEETYPKGINATELNDIFAFNFQGIMAAVLGVDVDEEEDTPASPTHDWCMFMGILHQFED